MPFHDDIKKLMAALEAGFPQNAREAGFPQNAREVPKIAHRPSEETIALERALFRGGVGSGPLVGIFGYTGGYGYGDYNKVTAPQKVYKEIWRCKLTKTGEYHRATAGDIERETAKARSWISRNLREWPHGHKLCHDIVGDDIIFYFEKE